MAQIGRQLGEEHHAQEEATVLGIAELGAVEDVAILLGQKARDRRHDPLAVRAGERQHELAVGDPGGIAVRGRHVRAPSSTANSDRAWPRLRLA